ncbi:LOW QUALITY PROTEIN: zf-CCHC domain-containing protein/UBN2 domain-containing protein [Cephalotus follicularis]|uniref:Zf-CCHC domain-containing protein/UBN2 domain-containing protein n=1 Tax=Cephalotus follicularis TaxID=3775 RepID=A0A1Q3C890_CEPFO|nr:LOW QUALITY PROTEIN: zf-CCHC domain-containing protein/UBN2 domain-containing protein [Cephalotus follicularis]
MTIFLQSLDYQLWHIIVNGPRMPTRTIEGVVSPTENEYNDNDFRMLQLNSKVKHVLFYLLEVSYEGTNQVKESKISMLVHEYELFMMQNDECISDMFTRFTITNSLKNLGKSYSNQELIRKILRCLPKSWTPKVTAIEEAKDLSTLPLEQLLGSLMTHETTMKNHENVEVKKKKTIALKAFREESESDEDDDIILISKQFKKFLKSQKGKKAFKKKASQDEESSKREEPTCFECKKPGHFKNECPFLKKKEKFNKEQFKKKNEQSKKKKAMVATWDDSDPSSFEEEESDEEVVNLALMAREEDTSGDESENEVHFTFEELQNAYENLFKEYENICLKNKTLKKNAMSTSKEIDNVKSENSKHLKEIESLKDKNSFYMNEIDILNVSSKLSNDPLKENEKLKIEIDALKKSFSTFSNSSAKLDNLLGLQRCVFDKAGLGYEQMKNVKHFNNFFVKKVEPQIVCNYCGRLGHISTSYFYKNNIYLGKTKKIWVPKGTLVTNLQGPKFKWVPKT